MDTHTRYVKNGRVATTVFLVATMIYTVIFNAFAGSGKPPFNNPTGNVSDQLFTCITPAGFTFSIWAIIYICLILIVIYAIALLFLKTEQVEAWKLGGAISTSFILVLAINLNLNVGWLFAWDAINVTGSAIILLLVALTNGIAISLALYNFSKDAARLYTQSKFHFWCGILVINGMGIYDTWTTLASFLNLTIFFKYKVELDSNAVCLGMLIFILVAFIGWFILENTVLKVFANPLITHYMVLVWAMVGIYEEQQDLVSEEVTALIIALMAAGSFMLVVRIVLIIYRNNNNAIYRRPNLQNGSKVDIDTPRIAIIQ